MEAGKCLCKKVLVSLVLLVYFSHFFFFVFFFATKRNKNSHTCRNEKQKQTRLYKAREREGAEKKENQNTGPQRSPKKKKPQKTRKICVGRSGFLAWCLSTPPPSTTSSGFTSLSSEPFFGFPFFVACWLDGWLAGCLARTCLFACLGVALPPPCLL